VIRVTVLGGGTGSFTLLQGLRLCDDLEIRSVVTMMDSGGDSGRLRDEFGVLPPGDMRRCLVALSDESAIMRDLFSFRFSEPPLQGRSFGNLFLLALTRVLGSEQSALEAVGRMLKIRGRVIPVTWQHAQLFAELDDGNVVEGEANIDVPKHDASIGIRRVYLEPRVEANPDALNAIETADFVVLAPGDLYTSTIANLLVGGVAAALARTRAPLVYILNLMTKYGETNGYSASRHVAQIAHYSGRVPDAVVVHSGSIPPHLVAKYREETAFHVEIDADHLMALGVRTIWSADVMSSTSLVRHDPRRTADVLLNLFRSLGKPAADVPNDCRSPASQPEAGGRPILGAR
jgi:uncharacterized cofD-like protein